MATPRLTPPALVALERLHRVAVKRLLLAEAAALALLKAPVTEATARLQAQIAGRIEAGTADLQSATLSALRSEGARLQADFRAATLAARDQARGKAIELVHAETAPIQEWAATNATSGLPEHFAATGAAELDAFEAERAASAMSTAWASAGMHGMTTWERANGAPSELPKALRVDPILAPKVERHAAVQSTTAYAHEHRSYWDGVLGKAKGANDNVDPESGEPLLPYGWLPGVFQVWSAILDRRTCSVCFGLDGTMVPAGKSFPEGADTPLHAMCRCLVLTTFVDEGLSRKLPGMAIDYEALKGDVRDYFRGQTLGGLMGTRHAGDFISGTRAKTAPETLVRKVRNRRGYLTR